MYPQSVILVGVQAVQLWLSSYPKILFLAGLQPNFRIGSKSISRSRKKGTDMLSTKFTNQLLQWSLAAALLAGCMPAAPYGAAPAAESAAAPSAEQFVQQREAPAGMFFEDYGVNGFVETAQDHLSTFAVDVDTGAYTVVRGYLNDGNLPPTEAVRVEEFVNYFDYHYPYPAADETFGITIDAAPQPSHGAHWHPGLRHSRRPTQRCGVDLCH